MHPSCWGLEPEPNWSALSPGSCLTLVGIAEGQLCAMSRREQMQQKSGIEGLGV